MKLPAGDPGPIFAKELLELARRRNYWYLRIVFGLFVLATMWLSWSSVEGRTGAKVLAQLAELSFVQIAMLQYFGIHLLVPIVLCGSVADERRHGTLDLLFTTPLTDWEIIAGKTASRFLVVASIAVSGLPALALMTFWGGFTPTMVIGLEVATLCSGFFAASLSVFYSVISATSLRALGFTLAVLFGLFVSVVYWWVSPTFLLFLVFGGNFFSFSDAAVGVWAAFWCVVWLGLSCVLLTYAARRLREQPEGFRPRPAAILPTRLQPTAAVAPEIRKLREFQKKVVDELGKADRSASRFDFSERPEIGCIMVLGLNLALLSLPFLMAGIVFQTSVLLFLLAAAAMVIGWMGSTSVYLDPRRGFRELILSTPLDNADILRLVLRRWRTGLLWSSAFVAASHAILWIHSLLNGPRVFQMVALSITELLLAVNLAALCLANTLPAESRTHAFMATVFACLTIAGGVNLVEATMSLRPPEAIAVVWTLAAALLGGLLWKGKSSRTATRFVVQLACCVALFRGTVLAASYAGYTSSSFVGSSHFPRNPIQYVELLAMSAPVWEGGGWNANWTVELILDLSAFWLALSLNVWLCWRWLCRDFDRFVDRPRAARGAAGRNRAAPPGASLLYNGTEPRFRSPG